VVYRLHTKRRLTATPTARREAAGEMRGAHPELSERRACRLAGLGRSSYRYTRSKSEESGLRERLKKLAAERRRYGYRRLTVLLKRAGEIVNHML
jgi:putative transposase